MDALPQLTAGLRFRSGLHDHPMIMQLSGELDLCSAASVECAVKAALRSPTELILDLSLLTFCDCCGVRALLNTADWCAAHGSTLRLAGPRDGVLTILNVFDIGDIVPTFPTLAAAVAGDDRDRICRASTVTSADGIAARWARPDAD